MTVGEFVIIDHQTAGGGAIHIGIPAFHEGRIVAVLQDGLHEVGDGVSAAKSADNSTLGEGILSLANVARQPVFQGLGRGPQRGVMPVCIGGKNLVGVDKRTSAIVEDELAVFRSRGPVHQAGKIEGSRVEAGDGEFLRQPAGNGRVLIRAYFPAQRDHNAVAGSFGRVAVGRVEDVSVGKGEFQVGAQLAVAVVAVQAYQAAIDNRGVIAVTVLQVAADEAADVLDVVPFALRQMLKLRRRLTGSGGVGELFDQLTPQELLVLPGLRHSAASNGDQELPVMGYVHVVGYLLVV